MLAALGPPPYNHSLLFAPFHPVPEPVTHGATTPSAQRDLHWPVGVSRWTGGNTRADSSVSPSSSAVGSEKGIGGGGGRTEARGRLDGDWRLGDPRLDSFEPNPENLHPQPTQPHASASSGSASMAAGARHQGRNPNSRLTGACIQPNLIAVGFSAHRLNYPSAFVHSSSLPRASAGGS
jgi:hypothetical protein